MKKPETGMSFINQKLQSVVKSWPQNTRIEFQSEILDYIKTLQFRYLGENTVSGPIDFHSHAMVVNGIQNHLVTNFNISLFVFHSRMKVIGTTLSQSLTSKYKNLITKLFCSTIKMPAFQSIWTVLHNIKS